ARAEAVNAATVELRTNRVDRVEVSRAVEGVLTIIGEAPTAQLGVEQPRNQEHAVAQYLGLDPQRLLSPEQARVGVGGKAVGSRSGCLAIRARGHDQAVHFFQAIFASGKLCCEPVEQFGMTGPATVEAEIVRRLDEAGAEMVMPHAIDADPRKEGVLGR